MADASVELVAADRAEVVATTESQPSGSFALSVPEDQLDASRLTVLVERHHFETIRYSLTDEQLATLRTQNTFVLPITTLNREFTLAFWIATFAFVVMLALIALEILHRTLAALSAVAVVFASSYLGGLVSDELYVFDFERAVDFVDWEVIFLIMGMMMVIAVVERSGMFQRLAYFAYRLSRGRPWVLVMILMFFTAVASALLDNVTTMLLMTPITVQIALSLDMNPLPLLIPEVMAANVGGVATLIGDPPNILIGSYANIPFSAFIITLAPGVLIALVALIAYAELVWFRAYRTGAERSPQLEKRLAEGAQITDPQGLRKAAWVGAAMLVLFLLGEQIHITPAATALLGATTLLVWIQPDIEEMIEAVDWTTLVFFMGLFMMVGATQEVGLLARIATIVAGIVGDNLLLALILIIWVGAFMSAAVDNIPFTAAMLPVVGFLSSEIPGATNNMLFFALAVGAGFGGNGTLIGASPNLITAGISERAGYPITYRTFLKYGLPATVVTLAVGTLWLFFIF